MVRKSLLILTEQKENEIRKISEDFKVTAETEQENTSRIHKSIESQYNRILGLTENFSKLYSEGKINSMSCGYDSMINYAFSYIIGECKDPEAVYDEFRGVIERALVNGLNLDDFNRIKKVSIANFVKNYDSTESIANDALYLTFDGILPHEYARLLSDVDYEYTNDLLLDFFSS